MIDFLKQLIQIESISPRDMGCFDLIEERLNKLHLFLKKHGYEIIRWKKSDELAYIIK